MPIRPTANGRSYTAAGITRTLVLPHRDEIVHSFALSIDQPTTNNILSTLEKSEDNFVAVFLSNLPKIFCYDRRTIVTHLEDKHSEESLFELQNKQLLEKFPQYVGSKVIKINRKYLLAGDVYQFGY